MWYDRIWLLGAIIYVLGMFLIFYEYQYQGVVDTSTISYISIAGAFILIAQMFIGALDTPKSDRKKISEEPVSK